MLRSVRPSTEKGPIFEHQRPENRVAYLFDSLVFASKASTRHGRLLVTHTFLVFFTPSLIVRPAGSDPAIEAFT